MSETKVPTPMLQYCNMLHNMDQLNNLKDSLKEVIDEAPFPQAPTLVSKAQQECNVVKKLNADDHKQQITVKTIKNIDLAHYKNEIYIPTPLTYIAEWYRAILVHPCASRLEATLKQVY